MKVGTNFRKKHFGKKINLVISEKWKKDKNF